MDEQRAGEQGLGAEAVRGPVSSLELDEPLGFLNTQRGGKISVPTTQLKISEFHTVL